MKEDREKQHAMEMEKAYVGAYDNYSKDILRHIIFRVDDPALAEDFTSDTFIKTWQYIREGKTIDNMRSFLYRTANNLVIDYYRTRKPVSAGLEEAENLSDPRSQKTLEKIDKSIEIERMKRFLRQLPDDQRMMVVYKYIDELTVNEISKITGKSVVNVYVIIHRALKILKKQLEKYEEDFQPKINIERTEE